jgi:CRP-like cAMP-binding protein
MKKTLEICDIQSCFLCKRCLPDWLPAVGKHKANVRFKKGASIFTEGMPVEGIYFVYSGKVKIHKQWGNDKDLIIRFVKAGDILGYRGLGNERVYAVSATALEEAVLCYVDLSFFESTLRVNHSLTYELMEFYANELLDAERRMRNMVHMEVRGRIAETLLTLKQQFGNDNDGFIDIVLTKQDLASYSGTTYESFSRIVADMVKDKIIKVSGKSIGILKSKKLEEFTSAS